jgi:hypothetical protein
MPTSALRYGSILVVRRGGERQQRLRRLDQARRQRQLAAQSMRFHEVVLERDGGLRADGIGERAGVDERIAVAIAADPRSSAQERRNSFRADAEIVREPRPQIRVQPGDLVQERITVVREPVVDLVLDLQLRQAQHRRLPQLEHLPVERGVELGRLFRRERDPVAPAQQSGDLALRVENALALDLGRMRGQHRHHERIVEPARKRGTVDARGGQAFERVRNAAALRRRPGERVRAAAPVLVHVLGDVREVREIAEGAHHMQRVDDTQRIQQRGELGPGCRSLVGTGAAKADGGLPDRLDASESGLAGLGAQHVAQHTAQQARVFLERQVLVDRGVHIRSRMSGVRCQVTVPQAAHRCRHVAAK